MKERKNEKMTPIREEEEKIGSFPWEELPNTVTQTFKLDDSE